MTFADLSQLLADLACQPAIVLLCVLIGSAAGFFFGLLARSDEDRYAALLADDAGDTQAHWTSRGDPS